MDDKERKERIDMLNAQKAELSYKLLMRRRFAPKIIFKDQLTVNFENTVNAQIDAINAKLFLLGG